MGEVYRARIRSSSGRWRAPPQGIFGFDQTDGFDPADPEPIPDHASRGALEFDQSLPD